MITLQETLDKYQPYVLGIRYVEGHVIVDCLFNDGWIVPEVSLIKKISNKESPNYITLFCEDKNITLDDILDYVWSIIQVNKEREDKKDLYKETVEKLKNIFKNNTLTLLKTLKINFDVSSDDFPDQIKPLEAHQEVLVTPTPEKPEIDPTFAVNNQIEALTEEELEILEEEKKGEQYLKQKGVLKQNSFVKEAISQTVSELPVSEGAYKHSLCECEEGEACSKCIDSQDF